MPSTSQKYRSAQIALRARTLKGLLKLWPAFDVNNIKRTWPAFEEASLLLVQTHARTSAGLASAFYRMARERAGASGLYAPKLFVPPTDAVVAGLQIVGPYNAAKQLALGQSAELVARNTLVNLSGETTRHVLNAGRKTIVETTKADGEARGWARETSGDACSFCQMLADRGGVYTSMTADFEAHRHCGCVAVPAF